MDYESMLDKAISELPKKKEAQERFVVPKVMGHIQGNKTIISNFHAIAKALNRDVEHVLKYILKELGTPGELTTNSMIIGSKVSATRINEKINDYVNEFVLCPECKKPDTTLSKEKIATFITCQVCGAKKPVKTIK
jgi:translation initiation factor 2 subunit 2